MTNLIKIVDKFNDSLWGWNYSIKNIKVTNTDILFDVYDYDYNPYTCQYNLEDAFEITIPIDIFLTSPKDIIKTTVDEVKNNRFKRHHNIEIKKKSDKVYRMLKNLNDDSHEVKVAMDAVKSYNGF